MENNIPIGSRGAEPRVSVLAQTVDRSLEARRASVAAEVRSLVEGAFAVIQRTGSLEPRVSEIVREAGLSNQAFYRHFRSKHELLVAVLDEGVGILASYLAHRMAQVDSPRAKICEWVRGMLEQALDPLGAKATRPFVLARARLAESFPDEVARSERQLTAPLREAIAAAVGSGELPNADPECDADSLYHMTMGWLQTRLLERGPASRTHRVSRQDAASLEQFALAGLARGVAVPVAAGE